MGGRTVRRRKRQLSADGPQRESLQAGTVPDEGEPVNDGAIPGSGKEREAVSCSQNLEEPIITYTVCAAASWRKEPKPRKGAVLYKFDDGATCVSGYHEISGYPYQEYFEIFNE